MAFGFLKKAIKGIGKGISKVGKVAKFAAPFIPGVGPLAAAGIAAGGALVSGSKPLSALAHGAGAYGGAKLIGKGGIKNVLSGAGRKGILDRAKTALLGKAKPGTPGTPAIDTGVEGEIPGTPGTAPSRTGGLLGKVGGFLGGASKAAGGPLNLAKLGLAGASLYSGAKAGGRANKALERGLNPPPVSLGDEFATDNPYAVPTRPNRAVRAASRSLAY